MRRQIAIVLGAGTVCLVLAGIAWNAAQAARVARSALLPLAQRRAHLNAELVRGEARIGAAVAEREKLHAALESLCVAPAVAGAARPPVMALDPKAAAAMDAIARIPWRDVVLEKNPELQARYLAVRRAEIAATYGAFWTAAGLSASQIDTFKAIMVAATERTLDLKSAMRAQGLAEFDPAIATLQEQSEEQVRAAQRDLLGDVGYQRFVEFERVLPVRGFVDGLAGALALAEAPLSAAQADQLSQIMANANDAYLKGGRASSPAADIDGPMRARQPAREAIDSERVLAEAKGVLSPAQFTRFEAEILRVRALTGLYNAIRQSSDDPVIGFTIVGRK